ncbi:hypothetical protein BV898_15351 [Hypsibius exemplaris]|uniref:Uncharacterized protein n=1 Tax=Hypsibius exemplaris TaxID=2072580 RepID=A0A9X6NAT4_HYPEX|nr:hypothetical protein BV898_15351 [Hypsibius exemplaris]
MAKRKSSQKMKIPKKLAVKVEAPTKEQSKVLKEGAVFRRKEFSSATVHTVDGEAMDCFIRVRPLLPEESKCGEKKVGFFVADECEECRFRSCIY